MDSLLQAFLIFLPAGIANMTPIFASRLPLLNNFTQPIDGYRKFRNRRILGDHKTWRGLISGVMTGTLASVIMGYGANYGILISLGALGGDAAKSFFKRQLGIPSGSSWFPFDQTDYIIGGLLLARLLGPTNPTSHLELWILVLYFFLHLISSFIGYLLKLKSSPI